MNIILNVLAAYWLPALIAALACCAAAATPREYPRGDR
jgi:hypothetical protein